MLFFLILSRKLFFYHQNSHFQTLLSKFRTRNKIELEVDSERSIDGRHFDRMRISKYLLFIRIIDWFSWKVIWLLRRCEFLVPTVLFWQRRFDEYFFSLSLLLSSFLQSMLRLTGSSTRPLDGWSPTNVRSAESSIIIEFALSRNVATRRDGVLHFLRYAIWIYLRRRTTTSECEPFSGGIK